MMQPTRACLGPGLGAAIASPPPLILVLKPLDRRLLAFRRDRPRHSTLAASSSDTPAPAAGDAPPAGTAVAAPAAGLAPLLEAFSVPDAAMAKQLGLTEAHLQSLMELPGTTTVSDLKSRLVALAEWNSALRRGVLPRAAELAWPQEPFRSKFLDVLKRLEMPRFTRRHPKLLGPLIRQFLQLVDEFESELLAAQPDPPKGPPPPTRAPQPPPQQPAPGGGGDQDAQEDSEGQGGGSGEAQAEGADAEPQPTEAAGEAGAEGGDERGEVQAQLEAQEGGQGDATQPEGDPQDASGQEGFAERLAQQMLDKFEGEWSPAVEALEVASRAFDDVDGLLDGPDGFDSSSSVWRQGGWREVDALRRRLESLRELRDLVRSLGRGGGKGPLKRAPEVVWAAGRPPGVVRSEQSPEETRGLSRSGDLSRMLPSEARLLAAGWPTSRRAGGRGGGEGGKESGGESGGESGDSGIGVGLLLEGGEVAGEGGGRAEAGAQGGSRAARMLFMARRAERMLMSYERAGWVEDEPSRATGRMEVRPAAELGPIIVCLDTSGSMHGPRETVAKALALECMRGAHRQGRRCYLYAFSGPGDVQELELGADAPSLRRLLRFLSMGFEGGTDVDAPLALSLERVGREEWALADILMVTDGEIPQPNEDVLARLRAAHETLGLEVHGLLVGRHVTDPMRALCTHLHVFQSWSAVQ